MNDETFKNFKGQLENEIVLNYFRKHWVQILPFFLFLPVYLILLILALHFFFQSSNDAAIVRIFLMLLVIFFNFLIHHQFLVIFRYYLSTTVITNMRVILMDKSVYLKDNRDSMDMLKIQDVEKKQSGLLPHLFRFGELKITLSGGEPISIHLVPQPNFQFKKLVEIRHDFWRQHDASGGMDGT